MVLNPRYVRFATVHGRTSEAQMVHDRERWPGGVMTGFILWMSARWVQWRALRHIPRDAPLSEADHRDFDEWLATCDELLAE